MDAVQRSMLLLILAVIVGVFIYMQMGDWV